jgi:hypothetical protein
MIQVYRRSTYLKYMIQKQSMIQRCKHDMIQKWKCNMHMYIRLPTEAQKGKTTPSSPRKRANVAWSKCFVRISASCFSVGTWMRSMFPFSTLSLWKWYLTSICLVLECSTRFLATLIALVLSHMRGTWVHSSPKSLSVYVIQSSWEQQLAAATYSAFVVDWAT